MSHQLAPAMPQPRYPDTLLTQRKRQSFTLRDFTPCKGGVLGTGRFGASFSFPAGEQPSFPPSPCHLQLGYSMYLFTSN